jgi:2-dehydropantoate 2-reductase
MSRKAPEVAVVGTGAIGGPTAAVLAMYGKDMVIVCKQQEIVDAARSPGLHLFGVDGDHHVSMNAVRHIGEVSGPLDIVLLAVKAHDCVSTAMDLVPALGPDSIIVSLQNGICEHALVEVAGRDRIVGCVVGWGATMHGPGRAR